MQRIGDNTQVREEPYERTSTPQDEVEDDNTLMVRYFPLEGRPLYRSIVCMSNRNWASATSRSLIPAAFDVMVESATS